MKERLEKLKSADCLVDFKSAVEMREFMSAMEEADKEYQLRMNSIRTRVEENGEAILTAKDTDGKSVEVPLWDFSMRSLEKRSGDDASGHAVLTKEQILGEDGTMNKYWPNYAEKKVCVARERGGKIMGLGSEQYESISQAEMLEAVTAWLDDRHPDKWEFISGSYSHQLTEAKFRITDAISPAYKTAWKKTGLPQSLLDQSHITVHILTDDVAGCAAKAIIGMNVGGTRFLLGNPIEIQHRAGYGGIEAFRKELEKADLSIKDELDSLAKLMDINLLHPGNAGIMALKKAKIDKLSKKACKELVDDMLFGMSESAYIVYLFLHGVVETENGRKLSDDRKLRIITALRTLLKEDWRKLDVPTASL